MPSPHRLLTALVCGCFFALAGHAPAAPVKRPNILFFFADDWGRYASCYAGLDGRPTVNEVVRTPNIDRIAKQGVIFTRAFVGSPSCTPCRSALLSGRYFFNTGRGAILNGAVWDSAIPSWPLLMKDSGYHIGKSYKVWSPGTPVDAPYGGQKYGYEKAGVLFNKFSKNVTNLVAGGMPLEAAKQELLAQVRDNFSAFLADRKPGEPFAFWFGPTNTHRTWIKGSGKALWNIDPESLKGKMPVFLPDIPAIREDFADYLGESQAWDASVGVILKKLEESGEMDNTYIFISGDHGMGGMPHGKCNLYDFGCGVALVVSGPGIKPGRVLDDLVWIPDLAATFLELAGLPNPPGMSARSLMPILNSDKSGQVDPTRTWVITGRERHVASARENNYPYPQRALRTPEFLYIRNFAPDRWPMGGPNGVTDTTEPTATDLEENTYAAFADMDSSPTKAWLIANRHEPQWKHFYDLAFAKRPAEELYDVSKDPDEIHNVVENPAYAAQRKALNAQLMKTLNDLGDPRITGDGKTFDLPPFTDATPREAAKPRAKKL